MKHFKYISCLQGDAKEYGVTGMEYIPLYSGNEVDFIESVMDEIVPHLLEMGYDEDDDARMPGVGVYTYLKAGKEGSIFVCLVSNEGDDDYDPYEKDGFVKLKATVFATTHEFDSEGEEIEQWLKSL